MPIAKTASAGPAAGGRRHDHDSRREEHRLRDRVRDEDDRRATRVPDPQQLEVQPLTRHLVQGTEGLVHQQQRRIERKRPGDRDPLLHPARELPWVVVLEALELHQLEQLPYTGGTLLSAPLQQLERQRDVLRDRPPVVEHRFLEDDSVVVVEPGPVSGLAVDLDDAFARLDQVADDPQKRRLAAAGGADQRDELPRADLEIDPGQRRHARLERLREALDRDGRLGLVQATFSGARRSTRRSAIRTAAKNASPRAAHTMLVAHSRVGAVE